MGVSAHVYVCDFQHLGWLKKDTPLPNKPHLTNPLHFSQIKMFATQLTTAVNIFVLILMIPLSANVMKTSY